MNKKTGEFSAADMKKKTARKPAFQAFGTKENKLNGLFVCFSCQLQKPDAQIGRNNGAGGYVCIECIRKAKSISDGSIRHGAYTHEGYARKRAKANAKAYKSGRLPKWMFT